MIHLKIALPALISMLFASVQVHTQESQPARETRPDEPQSPDDPLFERIAGLILQAQEFDRKGELTKALEVLTEAKQLASSQNLYREEKLILNRIIQIQDKQNRPPVIILEDEQSAHPPIVIESPLDLAAIEAAVNHALNHPNQDGVLLTLRECIEIALQDNLNLQQQRLTDRSSDLALRNAYGFYYPEIDAGVGHNGGTVGEEHRKSTTFRSGISQRTPWGTEVRISGSESVSTAPLGRRAQGANGENYSAGYGIDLTQPLWRGAGTDVGLYDLRRARIGKKISRSNLELNVQDLIFSVKRAYLECQRQLQTREVSKTAVASARRFLELTQARERAGQVTRLDVSNAKLQLSQRDLQLIRTDRNIENAFDTLKQIMDIDLEEQIRVVEKKVDFGDNPPEGRKQTIEIDNETISVNLVERDAETDEPTGKTKLLFRAQTFDSEAILREALANRLDLINSHRALALRRLDTILAKDGLGHQIDLSTGYRRSGSGDSFGQANGFEDDEYNVMLNYRLKWGKVTDRTGYEQAMLELQRAQLQLKQARTQVHLEVRSILRDLREAERFILIQGEAVEQAKRSVEAARVSFQRALKDSFDVITSENNLLQAQTDFINSTLDYGIRLASLENVIGKPTGRVNLEATHPGGYVSSSLPDTLLGRRLPRPAPDAEPSPESDPKAGGFFK